MLPPPGGIASVSRYIFKLTTKEGNDEHKIIEDLSDKIPCPRATDDSGPEKLVTGLIR